MTNILAPLPRDLERTKKLLDKSMPSYRKAYSDRTAWLMACLSELAYVRFNPLFPSEDRQKWFFDATEKLVGKKSSLIKLIDMVGYDSDEEKTKLEEGLSLLKLQLIETFDCSGTQAILVSGGVSEDKFIVLAFRGTEAMSIKDIKTAVKAKRTQCETGGKVHSGFNGAFEKVAINIQNKINADEFREKPLFITGHSLGGTLATIAAKKLSHTEGGIAACYTFGAPRVGDEDWIANIKVPVYRLVNAADCVTMLPPGAEVIKVICWILRLVAWLRFPVISQPSKSFGQYLLSNFGGYMHGGNMRYMTNCNTGQYSEVKLLYSVSWFRRIYGWWMKQYPWKKFLADHSISIYRKKLMVIAEKRNPDNNVN